MTLNDKLNDTVKHLLTAFANVNLGRSKFDIVAEKNVQTLSLYKFKSNIEEW
jgi:hypothetical protein